MSNLGTFANLRMAGGRRRIAAAAVLAAVLGILSIGQSPAASARVDATTGVFGNWSIANSPDRSNSNCLYQPFVDAQHPNGRRLVRIEVRPPVMYARNRTAGTDSQPVWYVATLTRVDQSGNHTPVEKGPIQTSVATDVSPASFPFTSFDLSNRGPGTYSVVIDMSWRQPSSPNGIPEGTVKFTFDDHDQSRLLAGGSFVREWYQAIGCNTTFTW